MISGCATSGSKTASAPANPPATIQPGVDPVRARMTLDSLPPTVSPPARTAPKPLSDRAAQQVAAAQTLIEQQRFTEASLELERALRYDPNHPTIHRVLASLHWQAGNVERARASAQRALEGNNDDAAAHMILARCFESTGERTEAIREYRVALLCGDFGKDHETAVQIRYRLAQTLATEGYLTAALGQYEAVDALLAGSPGKPLGDPELAGLLRAGRGGTARARADILEKLGRFREAADLLEKVVSGGASDPATLLQYSRLLLNAGRTDEALRTARSIPDDSDQVVNLLTEIHAASGHPERVIDDLRARQAARPGDIRLTLRLADTLRRFNRVNEARQELAKFLEYSPDAWNVRLRLLEETMEARDWSATLSIAVQAAQLQPARMDEIANRMAALATNPDARAALMETGSSTDEGATAFFFRGLIASKSSKLDAAEELLRNALARDKDHVPARAALAEVLLRRFQYEEALAVAQRREEAVPEDAALERVLGRIHERLDDVEKAVLHFRAASQMNSADTDAPMELARLYRNTDDSLSAQRLLRLILEKNPLHEDAREALVVLYLQEGKLDAATEQLEELRRTAKSPHAVARAQAMLDLIRNRDAAAFRASLEHAIQSHGPDPATWSALAESYSEFEQDQARQAYLKVLAIDPDHEEAALGVIFAEQRLLHFESARDRFLTLLPRRPNRHVWRFGWPGPSWRMGIIELLFAVQDYDTVLQLAKEHAERPNMEDSARTRYRLAMIEALHAAGRSKEALELLESWRDAEGTSRDFWSIRLAREHIRQDQAVKAVPFLEAAHAARPTDRSAFGDLVEGLVSAKEFDRAAQYALGWLMDDPANDDALSMLMIILIQQDRVRDALELARNRLLFVRDRERFQDIYIAALDRGKRHTDAVEYLEALASETQTIFRAVVEAGSRVSPAQAPPERYVRLPNEPFTPQKLHERLDELNFRLADQLVQSRRHREAERRLREWLEESRNPRSRFRFLLALANSQRDRGDEVEATKTMELALALQPDHVGINNDVAYGWIDRGIRLDDAERMIAYSVSREPRQMAYLDTYGWLLYKKGRLEEARKWLERAVRARREQDPVILDHLGDTLWRLGEKEAAQELWASAIRRTEEEAKENPTADEKRVKESAPRKLEDARAGREPAVAPLAGNDKD